MKKTQKNTTLLITIIVCSAIVVVAGIAAYVYLSMNNKPSATSTNNDASTAASWDKHNEDGRLVGQKWNGFIQSCMQSVRNAHPSLNDGSFNNEAKIGTYCGGCAKDALTDLFYATVGGTKPSNEQYKEDFAGQLRDADSILAWGDTHSAVLASVVAEKCSYLVQ